MKINKKGIGMAVLAGALITSLQGCPNDQQDSTETTGANTDTAQQHTEGKTEDGATTQNGCNGTAKDGAEKNNCPQSTDVITPDKKR